MPAVICCVSVEPNVRKARSSFGIEAQSLAEDVLHLRHRSRLERRVHHLDHEIAEELGVPQLTGGGVRNEHALLVRTPVIRELHLLLLDADHVEGHSVDADLLADRRHVSEQLPRHLAADEHHFPLQPHVFGVDEPAAGCRLRANRPVGWRNPAGAIACLLRVPGDGHLLHVLRTPRLDQRELAHRFRVRQPEAQALAGALAAGLHAGLLREHDRDAVAERAVEAANERLVEPFTVREQHHDGDDAPGDAEHREAGAHPVAYETDGRPRGRSRRTAVRIWRVRCAEPARRAIDVGRDPQHPSRAGRHPQ